ncbi:MAG TPA: hypothetical protein VF824_16175 [Thermoanaerobaculia bacterium]|jgi:hypothetical protein
MRPFLLAMLAAGTFVLAAEATPQRQIVGVEQDHSLVEAADCEHFYSMTFTSFPAQVRDQVERDVRLDGVTQLRISGSEEGGISVHGWSRPYARLVVCRSAVADTEAHARRVLDAISVSHTNGEITAHGPASDATQSWWVNLIVHVPRKTSVDIRGANGGVAIRNMHGRVTAATTRGGISVAQSSGRYTITSDSGGITLDRVNGRVDAASHDGGIALKLTPEDEPPSIEARTASNGTIVCNAKDCRGAEWTGDRKQLRIGAGDPDYRLSTAGAFIVIDFLR